MLGTNFCWGSMTQSLVRPGRREERAAQIRADLLASAESLLAEKGFDRATITDITSGAGVGFGTFYNYFSSKEELYQELVRTALEVLIERIDERCRKTEDYSERLRAAAEESVDFAADRPDLFLLLFTTNSDVHSAVHAGVQELEECMHGWLRPGFEDGSFQPVDPKLAVRSIIGILAFVLRPLTRRKAERAQTRETLTRLIQGAVIGTKTEPQSNPTGERKGQ
jgi:AcrR family transcriptional regulator